MGGSPAVLAERRASVMAKGVHAARAGWLTDSFGVAAYHPQVGDDLCCGAAGAAGRVS